MTVSSFIDTTLVCQRGKLLMAGGLTSLLGKYHHQFVFSIINGPFQGDVNLLQIPTFLAGSYVHTG